MPITLMLVSVTTLSAIAALSVTTLMIAAFRPLGTARTPDFFELLLAWRRVDFSGCQFGNGRCFGRCGRHFDRWFL